MHEHLLYYLLHYTRSRCRPPQPVSNVEGRLPRWPAGQRRQLKSIDTGVCVVATIPLCLHNNHKDTLIIIIILLRGQVYT